jgi:hypothetical protein
MYIYLGWGPHIFGALGGRTPYPPTRAGPAWVIMSHFNEIMYSHEKDGDNPHPKIACKLFEMHWSIVSWRISASQESHSYGKEEESMSD